MGKYYIYKMEIEENDKYFGSYIGQHKIGKKEPLYDGYKGSGSKWRETILKNHIPVKKTIIRLCDSIEETNYWEHYYIEQAKLLGECLWNVVKGGGGHEHDKIYTEEEIKAHNKERLKKWYESNREHYAEYKKKYYAENKDHLSLIKKKYREEHKELYEKYAKQYYKDNKDRLAGIHKRYYEQNKDRINELKRDYCKQYRITHAEQEAKRHKKYNDEHKAERNQYYTRQCSYNGEILTFRALALRLRRKNIANPTEVAKQYLITEVNNYEVCCGESC